VLAADDFFGLTRGDGEAETVERLFATERSWRMIALHGLLGTLAETGAETAPEGIGPLDSVAHAWQLLSDAEAADPDAANKILMYPQTGIWIAHLLRRLRRVVSDEAPLWLDTGYLHSLAAAAAVRAGLTFTITVPVRSGSVVLPTLGSAAFPGVDAEPAWVCSDGGVLTVTAAGHTIRIDPEASGWRPTPMCSATADGMRIEFAIDDVDPYRNMRGYSAPAPLPDRDRRRWQMLLADAWRILVNQDGHRAATVAAGIRVVVPLPAAEPYRPLSASCDESFAAVVASMPDDAEQFAVTLVHETAHVRLGALLHLVTFVDDNHGPRLYAPWRDDPRPLSGLLQGVYAFIGITGFWRQRRHRPGGYPLAEFEFALWRIQLGRVLDGLATHPGLSRRGHELVANLGATVEEWACDRVDADVAELASAIAADHYGQWRSYHLPVDQAESGAVLDAWLAGAACPPIRTTVDVSPVVDTSVRWLDGRTVLARMRLGDPEAFTIIAKDPADVARRVPGALPPDVAFVSGEYDVALAGYERHLTGSPGDSRAWLGLGLTRAATGRAAEIILRRAELVRTVARRLAEQGQEVSASALTQWMNAD
jgi:HEXXH motif-containing protein